jgi:hypothetical protein
MSSLRNDERGTALVEAPFAVAIVLMLTMGLATLAQVAWTHLSLSSAVRGATRYATHVDYDPVAGGIDRHRTEEQVRAWTVEIAEEADVDPADVTIAGRRADAEPDDPDVPIDELVAGDQIVITVEKVVTNPLYRLAASVTNTASHVVGAGDVFDPDGVGVMAGATSYVE